MEPRWRGCSTNGNLQSWYEQLRPNGPWCSHQNQGELENHMKHVNCSLVSFPYDAMNTFSDEAQTMSCFWKRSIFIGWSIHSVLRERSQRNRNILYNAPKVNYNFPSYSPPPNLPVSISIWYKNILWLVVIRSLSNCTFRALYYFSVVFYKVLSDNVDIIL